MLYELKSIEEARDRLHAQPCPQSDMYDYVGMPIIIFDVAITEYEEWEFWYDNRDGYSFAKEGRLEGQSHDIAKLPYFIDLIQERRAFILIKNEPDDRKYRLPERMMNDQCITVEMWWDRDDKLPDGMCENLVRGERDKVEDALWEWAGDYESQLGYEAAETYIGDHEEYFKLDSSDIYELNSLSTDEIYKEIYERYALWEQVFIDLRVNELLGRSHFPALISMESDYDCVNSCWFEGNGFSYDESYMGGVIDFLNMNPKKLAEEMVRQGMSPLGEFPDKPEREGSEAAGYADLLAEFANTTSGANQLTFLCMYPLTEYYENPERTPAKILIPKGTPYTMYSSFYGGGGALSAYTAKDIEYDIPKAGYDTISIYPGNGSYGPMAVYGCGKEIFGDEFSVLEWKEIK